MENVSPQEAARKIARGDAFALDVREEYEWDAGHIPQASHMSATEVGERLSELPVDRELILVCRSGNRSGRVCRGLRRRGFAVLNLEGGMKAWHAEGLPIEPLGGRVA